MDFRTLRENHKLSQSELARVTGISRHTIMNLEQRKFRPSHETIESLREVFGSELDSVDWTPDMPRKKRGLPKGYKFKKGEAQKQE